MVKCLQIFVHDPPTTTINEKNISPRSSRNSEVFALEFSENPEEMSFAVIKIRQHNL